LLQIKM